MYNWAGDSMQWRLLPKKEKIRTALYNLQVLYPEVDVAAEYAGGEPYGSEYLKEAFDMNWWGLTFYNPEQFQALHTNDQISRQYLLCWCTSCFLPCLDNECT